MAEGRYEVRWERPAAGALRGLSPGLKARIRAAVELLETDPYLEWERGKAGWSYAFRELAERGIPARVFRFTDARGWRAFYYVDERSRVVLVKELVPRRVDTYRREAGHVQRLVANYRAWVSGRIQ